MVLLSVGLLGLVKLQSYLELQTEQAEMTQRALEIAELQLEQYRKRSQAANMNTIPYASIVTQPPAEDNEHTYTVVIEPQAELEAKYIRIYVSWQDRSGVPQSISLETVISAYSEFES